MTSRKTGLIIALDTKDPSTAERWVRETSNYASIVKIGMELFYANRMLAIRDLVEDKPIFLDLKLHDIPSTVAGAIGSIIARIRPMMITLHAQGGPRMIAAARQRVEHISEVSLRPKLLAVTVLTSMDEEEFHAIGGTGPISEHVVRLGKMAIDAGADGLVCSPYEIKLLREALGDNITLVVPGIRPMTRVPKQDDQTRTMTPVEAQRAGADWIVVGRPITQDSNPGAAAEEIVAQLNLG